MSIKGIKLPRKEKKLVVSFDEEKHMGTEPKWDTERAKKFDEATFDHHLRDSFRYYNYFYTQKEMKKFVVLWAQNNMKLTNQQLSLYILSNPELTPMTVCGIIKAESVGMPIRDKEKQYAISRITKAIEITEAEPTAIEKIVKENVVAPTIQDRLAEKTADIIGEIEHCVDNAFVNQPANNIYDFITSKSLAQSQVGKVRSHFQKQIDEISEFVAGTCEQLNEGYAHLSKADLKRVGAFYIKLMSDLDSYVAVKRATKKLKVKRPQSKDKVISKVKHLKESKELKLVSVPLADILGAQVVWCYNVKYRKLGKYVADEHSTLGIKGTSITGYSESKSVQKTLRKPSEQLKEFMKAGKIALRTYLKDIQSIETKLNGRLNSDILILKIE